MENIPRDVCLGFLHRHRVGVMALANAGRAYAVPLFFAFDGKRLFFQSHPGEKDTYMSHCDSASFVVVEMDGEDDWTSIQATGKVEKITLTDDAMAALDAMAKNPFPPEFGVDTKGDPKRSSGHMYLWMMTPAKITGRRSRTLHPKGT